jgi:hypothetical protein
MGNLCATLTQDRVLLLFNALSESYMTASMATQMGFRHCAGSSVKHMLYGKPGSKDMAAVQHRPAGPVGKVALT